MPANVPADLEDKFRRCKEQVIASGQTEEAAYGICYMSVVEGKADAIEKAASLGFILDDPAAKFGRRHSDGDMKELAQIVESAIKLGAEHPRIMAEIVEATTKAADVMPLEMVNISAFTEIKAAGDWVLDVLGVPFGGPRNGKDTHDEYFSQRTKTYPENFSNPLVAYYHGYEPDGKPQGDPEIIGKVERIWEDAKGWWYRVILDRANEYAKRIWSAAQQGKARASSGSIAHLVRRANDGEILTWPVAELSLIDADGKRQPANAYAVALPVIKAHYLKLNQVIPGDLPDNNIPTAYESAAGEAANRADTIQKGINTMSENTKADFNITGGQISLEAMGEAVQAAVEAELSKRAKAEAAKRNAEIDAEVERRLEAAKRRLPGGAPYVAKFGETWKFDNYGAADLSFAAEVMKSEKRIPSAPMLKALALKMSEGTPEQKHALKMAGIKADETDYTSNTGFGLEWVGTAYSSELWEQVRGNTQIASKIPVGPEIPQGMSSVYIPLESTDPVFYKVAEATDSTFNSTTGVHNATVTPSPVGTGQKQITTGKLGARVIYTGEMEEDSLVPFAANARRQMGLAAAEVMDYLVLNGDTETGASTNINAIDTTPAATALYLITNGARKLSLVTNTANSRSAGGSLAIEDFLETIKLMGTAGLNGLDKTKCAFIIDLNTHWKALTLPEVQSRDVFSGATIENGELTSVWGYPVITSAFMQGMNGYASAKRLSNSAGKIDADTEANNLYGAILAVRFDQWQQRYKRRWTLETVRTPQSDTNEIVGLTRWGLGYRDTEAAAITYYVGV